MIIIIVGNDNIGLPRVASAYAAAAMAVAFAVPLKDLLTESYGDDGDIGTDGLMPLVAAATDDEDDAGDCTALVLFAVDGDDGNDTLELL
jgi:hypothetical protein